MNKFEHLKSFKKILVTGPQRSGTTIAAKIIAEELQYKYIDERAVDVRSLTKLYEKLTDKNNLIIHGPCFCSMIHWLDAPDTAVVLVRRDTDEIKKSEQKIGWNEEEFELKNYFTKQGTIAKIRYSVWENFQQPTMKIPAFELEYKSLSDHPLWISDRNNFRRRQFSLKEQE